MPQMDIAKAIAVTINIAEPIKPTRTLFKIEKTIATTEAIETIVTASAMKSEPTSTA